MLSSSLLLLLGASGINAFPNIMSPPAGKRDYAVPGCKVSKQCNAKLPISDAQAHIPKKPNALTKVSSDRTNCGILGVCNVFDAQQQYVSTSGDNAFIPPSKTDIRGPCPGLNAAANHNYLPRNGLPDIQSTTNGLFDAYGMAQDFGAFLAVFSILNSGSVAALVWSIGGPVPPTVLSGVAGNPQGISYSHNFYEGDTSITRCDAYTNGGDAHASSMTRWSYAVDSAKDGLYTLDTMARLYAKNTHRSILQNAYYTAPFVSTTVVSPAAYNFVVNFMSNHSEASPGGYLDGPTFSKFFSVVGTYPHFKWQKGKESIPDNWYRRPNENPYGAAGLVADLIPDFAAYPDTFRFGGNVNGKDSYVGVDIANVTNGAYNADTLLQGDNLGCFLLLNLQAAVVSQAQDGINTVAESVALFNQFLPDYFSKLQCPELSNYSTDFLTQYTGYDYHPTANPAGPQNC